MSSRQIHSSRNGARHQVRELLEAVFASEIIHPSRELYLVSPWVRDLPLIDNCSGGFRGLDPSWGRRRFGLVDLLALLVERGCRVVVATRDETNNRAFVRQLEQKVGSGKPARLRVLFAEELHVKGMLGDDYAISGSMNFTHYGLQHNDELVRYELEIERVAELKLSFRNEYGGEG
jgi:phosphatidylserine/phosphatidylglycerophosphate/cardiolipin synthase-like enzyme